MKKEIELLQRKLAREEAARAEAEQLLEQKSLQLYTSNEKLKELNTNLEYLVEKRTKALQETELEYQTMVESINDMIFRLDMQGNIVFTNQIAHKIIGNKDELLVGQHILSFLPEEDRMRIFIHFARQFLKRNCINYFEVFIATKFNKKIWLRLNVQFSSPSCKLCIRKQQALAANNKEVKAEFDCSFNEIIIVAHDITQQKIGQEQLEKSEKRYRELTESLPEMICEVDTRGILTYANKFAIDRFGYSREEVLNDQFPILDIFPKNIKDQVAKNIELILKHGESIPREYLVLTKSGETFPVIVYTTAIVEQEEVVGLRGVMFDITTRKNQELEIHNNLQQQEILSKISMNYNTLEAFDKKTNDAICTVGEHLQVSRVYIFEDSEEGLFTSNTYEWCNSGVKAQVNELQKIPYTLIPSWKLFLERDGIIYCENIEELPQDLIEILEPQEIKSILVLPLLAHGNIFGFIGFDECKSNRKWRKSEIELLRTIANIISNNFLRQRIQNELVKREKENRIIINSIPDVIIHADSEGKIIALKSAQSSNLLNLIKGDNVQDINTAFSKKLAPLFSNAISECLEKNEYQFEFKNLNWEEIEYFEARLVKLNEEEVLIIIRDVTVSKENEKQLEIAKNKAEEISKMKSEFLANVSHEIRTPLNAILGFSQWLHENTELHLHKEYLTSIINSGRNLLDVINNILDLSKLESGTMDIDLSPMNYLEIISDIKLGFQKDLEKKGLNFKITIEESVPDYIFMDELRFYQIIFNLVSNAIKFTNKGYIHVLAHATRTEVDDEVDLIISIEDTGIGIKDELQKKIFESFTQQYGESNRHYDGTGLGLAIVDGLLHKLNGSVQVKSVEGKGTTFILTFSDIKIYKPDDKQVQRKKDTAGLKTISKPCTIMVVDDIRFNIEVLKALINSEYVKFIEADNGTMALTKLGIEKPDLIFMDIRMPGLDGYEVTRIIKSEESLKHIPVIAFSASTIKSRSDFIAHLFDDFLQKPIFKKEVMDMLIKYLPNHFKQLPNEAEVPVINDELMSVECLQKLEVVIPELEGKYSEIWEKLKGSLVIYEIEDFKNQLFEFATHNNCPLVLKYCSELGMGLQTFDIELIDAKVKEYPLVIDRLKSLAEQKD